ncbi:MAG: ROK family protein [Chloroflexi bacterium]|nr:ROK family protein [Chloroflexota bacterium]
MMPTTGLVLSIDIGGSKILAALVDRWGKVLARDLQQTDAGHSHLKVLDQIEQAAARVFKQGKAQTIAIAAAGAIDTENGVVTISPNLPRWRNVPLKGLVEHRLGMKTLVLNDASAAALGEHSFGAGVGTRDMVFITVSTGVGGGIIIDGKLYQGANGAAGEIGHVVIDAGGPKCGCGNYGCLESLASGSAIARDATERISLGTSSSIPRYTEDGHTITAIAVAEAARNGDPLANEIVSRAARYLGMGLVSIVNMLNPEMVVIGGGVAQMGEMLLGPARSLMKEKAFKLAADHVEVVQAKLGADAGIVGAAAYAFSMNHEN